jgi:membrane fusion protein (multidrug efflux system)
MARYGWLGVTGIAAAVLIAGHTSVFAQQTPQAGPATPPTVETAAVKLAPVTREAEFVGSIQAIQQVQLVARVEGTLDSVNFTEGNYVAAGTLMMEIEKDQYQAALAQAQATLAASTATKAGAEATLKNADINLTRQKALSTDDTVSQSTVDQAQADRDSANAQVQQAQAQMDEADAQIKTAQLNLSYTDIVSPIGGRVGKLQITQGNLVSPNSGPLATVLQTDPIRVVFSISDREYLKVVDALKPNDKGQITQQERYIPRLRLSDGSAYKSEGKITFLDTSIDPSTGTIAVFAEFPNPELQLVPGQFVTVTVQTGNSEELPVVPAAAVQQDQDGYYVFTIGDGDKAIIRRITIGSRSGVDWAVRSGLAHGEVIIVSGIQKVRPGIVVKPVPAAGN